LSVENPFTFEGSLVTVQPVDHNLSKAEVRRMKAENICAVCLRPFAFSLSMFRVLTSR
jgi:hypothetical protein